MAETQESLSQELNLKTTVNKYIMKRTLLSLFALIVCVTLYAEKERRVYYLDCSWSMKSNKIWKDVCSNLTNAIDCIDDQNTELIVVPFAIDGKYHECLEGCSCLATDAGKNELKKYITSLDKVLNRGSKTYHSETLNDFYFNKRVLTDSNSVTYMFLMTDGMTDAPDPPKFYDLLEQWKDRYSSKSVYGFYVMLHPSARNNKAEKIINDTVDDHLWQVETANVNINLIRLTSGMVLNTRDNSAKWIDVPLTGNISHINLDLTDTSENYDITRCEKYSDYIRVYISPKKNLSLIPEYEDINILIDVSDTCDFDFLLTKSIVVRCENKHVDAISPTFNKGKKIEKLGEVVYHPKFWWSQEKSEELSTVLQLQPSDDAAANNSCVEFEFVDKDGKIIPTSELRIKVDDVLLDRNRFTANCNKDTYTIKFEYTPEAKGGKHQGYLRLVSHNIDRCGNNDLSSCNGCIDVLCWQINYDKKMNPLATGLLIFVITILGAILLWFVVFCPIIYPRFGSAQKTFTAPGMAPLIVKFKGARLVIVSATPQKKQSVWNRFWTGKIMYKIHPAFTVPIAFKPSKGRRILTKYPIGTYQVMPNPIPYVGTATIIDIAKNVKINVN